MQCFYMALAILGRLPARLTIATRAPASTDWKIDKAHMTGAGVVPEPASDADMTERNAKPTVSLEVAYDDA